MQVYDSISHKKYIFFVTKLVLEKDDQAGDFSIRYITVMSHPTARRMVFS